LVVGGRSVGGAEDLPRRIVEDERFRDWPLVVLTDEVERSVASSVNFLWTTFTRFEPGADIYAASTRVVRNHVVYEPPILIDARRRPGFPAELSCSPEIASRVTRRWREYFDRTVEMGDSESGHLDRVGG
jgi:hypothetical protein